MVALATVIRDLDKDYPKTEEGRKFTFLAILKNH